VYFIIIFAIKCYLLQCSIVAMIRPLTF
jgi:hypothetical protein